MDPFPEGFAILRRMDSYFQARTPNTAHKALQQGAIPPELFVYQLNNMKPLLEEPYDLDDIDRILARHHLDHRTALLLMEIFERLITEEDPETALFAAEGVNILEGKYDHRIQVAKARAVSAQGEARSPAVRTLARALYQLADLHRSRPVIRRFYLLEALQTYKKARPWFRMKLSDTLLLVTLYRDLNQPDRAIRLLEACRARGLNHPRLLLARADLEFRRGNALAVAKAVQELPSRPRQYAALTSFWTGSNAEEESPWNGR